MNVSSHYSLSVELELARNQINIMQFNAIS